MRKNALFLVGPLSLIMAACGPQPRESDGGVEDCPEGSTRCGDACVDLSDDADHCGGCGYECREPGSNACFNGTCACLGPNHEIADECDEPTACVYSLGKCIFPDYGTTETCDPIEDIPCDNPDKVCAAGYCTVPDCDHAEACNGWDDDCDGHTDADGPVPGPPDPLRRECYGGDTLDISVGECRAGEQKCYYGSWTPQGQCPGEVLPITESGLLACDGRDNDCNACVDDQWVDGALHCGMPTPTDMDIVFEIDISGSMGDNISATQDSIVGLETTYGAVPYIEWALESISAYTPTLIDVLNPLTDFAAFKPKIIALSANGGGIEPSYDSVWLTLTGILDGQLGIDPVTKPWDMPIIVVMTDENPQTLLSLTEADVCAAVASSGAVLAVFTDPIQFEDWDDCAYVYPLSDVAATMTSQLNDLFEQICAPMSMSMVKERNRLRLSPLRLRRLLGFDSRPFQAADGPGPTAP